MADSSLLLLGAAGLALPLLLLTLHPGRALRWVQRKRYQYEVTFSLYMMTPTEKFIFNSILFLFVSMLLIAAALYLPANTANLLRRAGYYLGGDDAHPAAAAAAVDTLSVSAARARDLIVEESAKAAAQVPAAAAAA